MRRAMLKAFEYVSLILNTRMPSNALDDNVFSSLISVQESAKSTLSG
jgi:hypothetical protein